MADERNAAADGRRPTAVSPPAITLPKGGGAIRGIGEKFGATGVNGSGSMTVPIATSPGRSGFGPQLSLSYDSGAGNGAFGFGWSLSLPSITRKTDRGLPTYRDADESDVFILSGSEDLVPVLVRQGARWVAEPVAPRTLNGRSYRVVRYRPRVDGLFARLERWTNEVDPADSFWRSISRDDVTTWYGRTARSRVADPADPACIFSWLLCESYDDRGNAVVYDYVAEDSRGIDAAQVHERNRTPATRKAARYLKRIRYGNRVSRLVQPDLAAMAPEQWMFEVVLDYDEGHCEELPVDGDAARQHRYVRAAAAAGPPWAVRPDPFSSHRSGFEVRTYRRCARVLTFHRFAELGAEPCLVRSTSFEYDDLDYAPPVAIDVELRHQGSTRFASFIRRVVQSGYVREPDRPALVRDGVTYQTYRAKSLPPLELEYSKAVVQDDIREMDAESLENLPEGVDGSTSRWVDLDGEGVPGILTAQADQWFYKRSLGGGHFAPLERVVPTPAAAVPSGAPHQLLDLAGDGQLDVASFAGPMPGFYERTTDRGWTAFTPFASLPTIAWDDPNLRFVDLDGDGHADLLITEQEVFAWYPSLAEEGFGPARRAAQAVDEEKGARVVFADETQSIYLADMTGDGLTDLLRLCDGEICYWPNLGYGRFGAKVTMDGAPRFDAGGQFSQERVRLADIDGSGTTDIIYLGRDGVRLYFNQSGNRWSEPYRLRQFPRVDRLADVGTADLLGNGTACLVWSSPSPNDARRPMRYVDLMGGTKPHLLVRSANNLGAETHVEYASSSELYLADRAAGRPWVTRLPFPVHVVRRVVTLDRISRNRFVTRYAYHHGHFDGVEREFRGFGMVEQWDTEELAALTASGELPDAVNLEPASHVPPVYTKRWFHTGVYLGGDRVSNVYAGLVDGDDEGEYYREPAWRRDDVEASRRLLDDTVLPRGLSADEEREACRALRGAMLRREVYALDASPSQAHPYTVDEENFTVSLVQPRGRNRHAVFFVHARETLAYRYERIPTDPRVAHSLTLDVDEYGNVRRSASIAYGRRQPDPAIADAGDRAEQTRLHVTCAVNRFTDAVSSDDAWRTPMPCESRTFELTGLDLRPDALRFTFDEVDAAVVAAHEIDYAAVPTPGERQKRPIEHVRTRYRPDDLGQSRHDPAALLPLGMLEPRAVPGESYALAFTPAHLAGVFGPRVTDAMLATEGRYVHSEGDASWWVPSGRISYSPGSADSAAQEVAFARQHFFLPHRFRDPFHTATVSTEAFVRYDPYDLLLEESRDAVGNRVTAGERAADPEQPLVARGNDYRVLQATLMMDANRNRAAAAFDALGFVVGTAVMGKPEEVPVPGDHLAGFRGDLTQAEIDALFADPKGPAAALLLAGATRRVVYDMARYWRERVAQQRSPVFTATLMRETHASEPAPASGLRIQIGFSYSDGFGREIQRKARAERGRAPLRDAAGRIVVGADGQPVLTPADVDPRWVGSGWTVFNNKGDPVRRYEPFFTDTHRWEFDVRAGVSPVLFYDPVGRVVATLHPDHTWEKIVFDAWRQQSWDASDTVLTADPRTDADVGDHFVRLPESEYLPTWYSGRVGGVLGPHEAAAAANAAVHASTPTVAHFDSLGRVFVAVAHNRFRYGDAVPAAPPTEERYRTRVAHDVEGNLRSVVDATGRLVARYDYDMLGTRMHQASMEAGERWLLDDATGKPLYGWNSRSHRFRTSYDPLRRPTGSLISESGGAEMLVTRMIYGDSLPNAESTNRRGRIAEIGDQSGSLTNDAYDFKGNLLTSRRRIAQEYRTTIDWSHGVPAQDDGYVSRSRYDALNRATQTVSPHLQQPGAAVSVTQPSYNEAGLLERVDVWLDLNAEPASLLDPATATMHAVTKVDYDAKGRRTRIRYGSGAVAGASGVTTTYTYDPLTSRLARLATRRPSAAFADDCPQPSPAGWPGCDVQSLRYAYDPMGNVTHIQDDAQQRVYFLNRRVEPSADYTYDATYRLIEATGREHLGQAGGAPTPHSHGDVPRVRRLHPGDGNAMGRYIERYLYDAVGNLGTMRHVGSDPASPGWTRELVYDEASQLEPGRRNNRLTRTVIGETTETYSVAGAGYDPHGNMLRLPQLQEMQWDVKDQLCMTRRQAVNAADADGVERQGERTWYVYDGGGRRVRKVTDLAAGQIKDERLYLGSLEIYRRHGADTLSRETLHVMDDARRIALVETRVEGDEPGVPPRLVRYQFDNHLGSATLELDEQAKVVSYEEYSPYGSTTYQAVRSVTETPKRYRFTGKERDEESGLYYHGARYYAPWIARWTSCDPAGLVDGTNTFAHARGSPVVLVDADGTQSRRAWLESEVDRLSGSCLVPGQLSEAELQVRYDELHAQEERRLRQGGPAAGRAPAGSISYAEAQRRTGVILGNIDRMAKDPLATAFSAGAIVTGQDPDDLNAALRRGEAAGGLANGLAGLGPPPSKTTGSAYAKPGKQDGPKASAPPKKQPAKEAWEPTGPPEPTAGPELSIVLDPSAPSAAPTLPPKPAKPSLPSSPFSELGPPVGGGWKNGVPWIDAGSVKPASKTWVARGGARAWTDMGNHLHGLPDTGTQAIAFYDAQGNVYLMVKRVGGRQETVWSGEIGRVSTEGLPGKFGDAAFGAAMEQRVLDRIGEVTGQAHVGKSGYETGRDWTPVVPRAPAANDTL